MLYSYECREKYVHRCGRCSNIYPLGGAPGITIRRCRGRRLNAERQLCMRMTSLQLLPDARPRAALRLPVKLRPFAPRYRDRSRVHLRARCVESGCSPPRTQH
eukprot:7391931-Prymnesium_polylepis.1